MRHLAGIHGLAWSPDGTVVATSSDDGFVKLWTPPVFVTASVEQVARRIEFLTGMELDAKGTFRVLDPMAWQNRRDQVTSADGERIERTSHPWDLSALIMAFEAAGKLDQAERLQRNMLAVASTRFGPDDLRAIAWPMQLGSNLLKQKKFADAELFWRDCLTASEKKRPDDWLTHSIRTSLGEALAGQKKYADAEPFLLAGYQGLKEGETTVPPQGKARLAEAEKHLMEVCAATHTKNETKLQGKLTDGKIDVTHAVNLTRGTLAIIEMQSRQFDTFLRLQDAQGKTLAENDDIDTANKNLNSRILFIPKEDGLYQITASSFQQTGRGEYDLTIRQYSLAKSK